MKRQIILNVYFDNFLVDSIYVDEAEAEEVAESIRQNGFDNYNEDVKRDWYDLCNIENTPKLSVIIIKE